MSISSGDGNHPKDRHVLAAAVRCEAEYLVTLNLKDFPAIEVKKHGVRAISPKFLGRASFGKSTT